MEVKAGDWVEVRTKEEILSSLNSEARLEGLPFMPEMLQFCGQKFRVYKRAHKTCDTATYTAGRRLPNSVHLDLRCDGSAHGGCQAACLLFWKEAWLKPADQPESNPTAPRKADLPVSKGICTEQNVQRATQSDPEEGETRYFCQATELPYYTTRLKWWKAQQYLEDYRSGNISLARLICGMIYATYAYSTRPPFKRLAPALHWIYDRVQSIRGGVPFPRRAGTAHLHEPPFSLDLNLQPGDLVRVKTYAEILATLGRNNKNKGLLFDAEMVPFCGGTYRVRDRVHRFIDEGSGKMAFLRTPAVILNKVWCQSRYSSCRMFCPRSIYSWWREVWLEKVEEAPVRRTAAPKPTAEQVPQMAPTQ